MKRCFLHLPLGHPPVQCTQERQVKLLIHALFLSKELELVSYHPLKVRMYICIEGGNLKKVLKNSLTYNASDCASI